MMTYRAVMVDGIGTFMVPDAPEERARDSEFTVRSILGWPNAAQALSEGSTSGRCGQEYSWLGTLKPVVRTMLDIGCNVLSATVWAARVWWPDSLEEVWAYDPLHVVIECARENLALVQRGIKVHLHESAVTADPAPLFLEDVRTGCSRTHRATSGVPVHAVHPRDLPAADAIKIDAEGVEGDLIEHYPHWAGVRVLMIEWHSHEHREAMHALASREGFVCVKDDCGKSEQGVACWVRA